MRNDFNLNVNRGADDVIIKGYVDEDNQVIITEPDIGSGGGGSADILKLTFTEDPDDEDALICSNTWTDVYEALARGVIVITYFTYQTPSISSSMSFISSAFLGSNSQKYHLEILGEESLYTFDTADTNKCTII